ncbi:putative integral membrane protein [Acanthocheilonema viteae]
MGHHHCIGKDCCHCARLSVAYFATLIIQAIVIVQTTAFLFLNYLRGTGIYSVIHGDLKYVLILLATVQLLWFISAAGTVYSMQRIIPYLMLPHIFTSLLLLFAAVLLITLTTYHIIKG